MLPAAVPVIITVLIVAFITFTLSKPCFLSWRFELLQELFACVISKKKNMNNSSELTEGSRVVLYEAGKKSVRKLQVQILFFF